MPAGEKQKLHSLNLKAATLSVLVSSSLFIIKIVIGILTNSIAMIASSLDSALDFLSSGINFYAIRHAQKPADHQHRYGHGKAEALAGFLQSIIIFCSGFYLIYVSIKRFFFPEPLENLEWGVGVMIISILLTYFLITYQKNVQKKSKSLVISADRLHYVSDLISNAAVVVSLLATKYFGLNQLDVLAGLGIAVFIIKGSLDILRQSFDTLMDKDISDKYREDILSLIQNISPDILGYHDLRSRSAGDIDFLEFHLELPSHLTVIESHELIEKAMYELKKIHPNIEIIVHTDPAELDIKSGKIKLFDREKPRFY
ncbi:MAG: cation diffusion facilitator family transporter [Spirochaetia bacterium]|nr:cation diffusion facilitator family transporter [Spirochaetia bacterium]